LAASSAAHDDTVAIRFEVGPPDRDLAEPPIRVPVDLATLLSSRPFGPLEVSVRREGEPPDRGGPGQIVSGPAETCALWFVPPILEAGRATRWIATLHPRSDSGESLGGFAFREEPGRHLDLLLDGRTALRYVFEFDRASETRRTETCKPYHQLFDTTGTRTLTKGPGGLYPHHRGIFVGWNRLTRDGVERDFWHMRGVVQRHAEHLERLAGPVLARHTARIVWEDDSGDPYLEETREVTAFRPSPAALPLVEIRCRLRARNGEVILNGDPEHAGIQFRARNDLADGPDEGKARYLFPRDGVDPHCDRDLPFAAMTFDLDGTRWTVIQLNHPDNPSSLFSAYRDYGRFGLFFTATVPAGGAIDVRTRFHAVAGDVPSRPAMQGWADAFAHPPEVRVLDQEANTASGGDR